MSVDELAPPCESASAADAEAILRHSARIGFYREQAAGQAVTGIARRCRRRNVQNTKILAAKSTVGDVPGGHLDDAIDFSIGRDADNARAAPPAIPNIALFIDR